MGVLEFFGTLIRNEVTSSSVRLNWDKPLKILHLFLDFNSMVHAALVQVLDEVNLLLDTLLHANYQGIPIGEKGQLLARKYKFPEEILQKNYHMVPDELVQHYQKHFNEERMDLIIIKVTVQIMVQVVQKYCQSGYLEDIIIAIDGVPSKSKMIDQRQRRYMGAIMAEYEARILQNYRDYLLRQPDHAYYYATGHIRWSRNKITPGTMFMHKLAQYLRRDRVQTKITQVHPRVRFTISDMYEVGEGEKKIVNYIRRSQDVLQGPIMICSPDADMILLSILLPRQIYILRYNQQIYLQERKVVYDLINIDLLKENIAYYINHHPDYPMGNYRIDRISRDLVCLSSLFGNDFIPRIETLNVKKGFQNILDAYLKTLVQLNSVSDKEKVRYLVAKTGRGYRMRTSFWRKVLQNLISEEQDFIKNNSLYNRYITMGQIKNVFDYLEINEDNLVAIFQDFRTEYQDLQNAIRNNLSVRYFVEDDQFMRSLKKSINIVEEGLPVNTTYLGNQEVVQLLRRYYFKHHKFPRLNINLHTYAHTIRDPHHQKAVQHKNYYEREIYKFRNMLDEYYYKFNAQPLNLGPAKIDEYYQNYFGVRIYERPGKLSPGVQRILQEYLTGLVWVFDYYFNSGEYINYWYYTHERAPLIQHIWEYLDGYKNFEEIHENLQSYKVVQLTDYFNPLEQLVYVSPLTPEILELLPENYRKYLSSKLPQEIRNIVVDVKSLINLLWHEKVSREIDCHSIIFLNKCSLAKMNRPDREQDRLFLERLRSIPSTPNSRMLSQNQLPPF